MKGTKQENKIVTYRSGERRITLRRDIPVKAKQNSRDFINKLWLSIILKRLEIKRRKNVIEHK